MPMRMPLEEFPREVYSGVLSTSACGRGAGGSA
jgi:hypothetical protein